MAIQEQDYITWNKSFEMGIPTIDAQHQKLVLLCNTFYQALLTARSTGNSLIWEASLVKALHECTTYVQTHLQQEELLMKAAGYPGFEAHKKLHDTFTLKILEMDKNFKTVSLADAITFVKFLYDWIIKHIAHEDKLYVKSLAAYFVELYKLEQYKK
jgi:hemerythrin-like metal-binding protein